LAEKLESLSQLVGKPLKDLQEETCGLRALLCKSGLIPSQYGSESSQPLSQAVRANRGLAGIRLLDKDSEILRALDLELLEAPRCGSPHIEPSLLPNELRENAPRGSVERGWDRQVLRVQFSSTNFTTIGISEGEAKQAFRNAMSTWNSANIGISFVEATFGVSEVLVSWFPPILDPEHFLETGEVYAHADFPPPINNQFGPPPLPVCFSNVEPWSVTGDASAFDIESVTLHELGHCIGLFHRNIGSIMYSRILRGQLKRTLDPTTIAAARSLYV